MRTTLRLRWLLAAVATAALVACGGGGDDAPVAPGGVAGGGSGNGLPASALSSVDGLVAFMRGLVATGNDTDSPIALGDAALPTSDTALPAPTAN